MASPSSNPLLLPYLTPISSSLISPVPTSKTPKRTQKTHLFFSPTMAQRPVVFEDFLPTMADKLGEEGFMEELCNGFRLLMDPEKGVITFESLKRNSALLGLQGLRDEELQEMVREGDSDGDGALNQMEFCILMVRLSPELMEESWRLVDEAFQQAPGGFMS